MKHVRHKPPQESPFENQLVVVCPQFKSGVNLSRIIRAAGCFGVKKIVTIGNTKIDPKIARDAVDHLEVIQRRSLIPAIKKLKEDGYRLVALEQTDDSKELSKYKFSPQSALVVGNERLGLDDETLQWIDDAVEITMFGQPHSLNVASAATIAIYQYAQCFI